MGASGRPKISRTAEAMALVRAVESLRGADRLFYDPLARGFLRQRWRLALALMRLPGMTALALAVRERQFPGVWGDLLCRTRFIDDALRDALPAVRQVVILGAGFDSRAYRIDGVERTGVFEVDRPDMIDVKRDRLAGMLGTLPRHVTFVAVDFQRDRLSEAMSTAGFQATLPTFFAWEGVTQYITQEAVEGVFDFITGAAPTSRVAFTYVNRAVIDGPLRQEIDRRIMSYVERIGEPWITGFDPAEMPAYLAGRGLRLIAHVGASDYHDRYLQPSGRLLNVYPEERVVVAEVV